MHKLYVFRLNYGVVGCPLAGGDADKFEKYYPSDSGGFVVPVDIHIGLCKNGANFKLKLLKSRYGKIFLICKRCSIVQWGAYGSYGVFLLLEKYLLFQRFDFFFIIHSKNTSRYQRLRLII